MKNIKPSIRFSDFYENWYVSKFSDVATVNMGQSPNGENYTNNPNDHILVQGNADIKKGWVQPRVWTTQVTKTADPGDIILCVRAPVGDVSKTTYKVVLGRGVAGIKGNEFIYYLLYKMKIEGYWTKFSTGSTFESINSNDIKEAVIAVPIKEEQIKIGSFFKTLDDTISLHQQELEALKQTKQGFLQKMFPRAGESIPEVRFPGFKKEWSNYKIADISKVTMGQSPSGKNYTSNPNDHILVQGNADLKKGYVHPRVWTTQVTKTANPGDIILCVRAPVGDVAKTSHEVVLGRGVASLEGGEFLYHLLYKMKSEGYWTRFSTGSTFESINSTDIKDAVVMIPCKDEQIKIGEFFRQLDEVIELKEKEIEALKETKKGFLQKMFV